MYVTSVMHVFLKPNKKCVAIANSVVTASECITPLRSDIEHEKIEKLQPLYTTRK